MQRVMTVMGSRSPQELGTTDAHSHAWIESVEGAPLEGLIHDDEEGICNDLIEFCSHGGTTLIDCQPGGCGRNGNKLRAISQMSGVNIVACTGFHLRRYYPQDTELWEMSPEEAQAFFIDEAHSGLIESQDTDDPVYPGFIKIAAEASVGASPMGLFGAAAEVSRETGLAIEMHTEKGAAVEDFLSFFVGQGLSPERLIFCHIDKRPDIGLHRELASAGVLLEYDTFVRPKYRPEENAWPLLQQMIDSGLSGQVALATDLAETNQWPYMGGSPGPVSFLTVIRDQLLSMNIPTAEIDMIMGGNINWRLAV